MTTKCIIPAAGSGVRFKELGRQYPKAILPYRGKPLLVHNIEFLLGVKDISEVAVVTGHQAEKIGDVLGLYFADELKSGQLKLMPYLGGPGRDGPAMSIASAITDADDDEEVLVVLGDILLDQSQNLMSDSSYIAARAVPDWQRWCMVGEVNGFVDAFYDKPVEQPPTDAAVTGIYYFKDGQRMRKLIHAQLDAATGSHTREYEISGFLEPYCQQVPTAVRRDLHVRDFGTLEEYLENREVPNVRSFNSLEIIGNDRIKKTSTVPAHAGKIVRELSWFQLMPSELQGYLPRIFESSVTDAQHSGAAAFTPSYTMERIFAPTLREFYLFLEPDPEFWRGVFVKLREAIETFQNASPAFGSNSWNNVSIKNRLRIRDLPAWADCGDFADEFDRVVGSMQNLPPDSYVHGDLCLSNIMFDPNRENLKFIDPLGEPIGNILYDAAKLMQCFVYGYDFVDAELYAVNDSGVHLYDSGKAEITAEFLVALESWLGKDLVQFVRYLTASLFLTMIPLHAHSEINQRLYFSLFQRARAESQLV